MDSCTTCENGYVSVHPLQHVAYMLGEIDREAMERHRWMTRDGHLKPQQPTYAACTCELGDRLTEKPKRENGKIVGTQRWLGRIFSTRLIIPNVTGDIEADMRNTPAAEFKDDFAQWQ